MAVSSSYSITCHKESLVDNFSWLLILVNRILSRMLFFLYCCQPMFPASAAELQTSRLYFNCPSNIFCSFLVHNERRTLAQTCHQSSVIFVIFHFITEPYFLYLSVWMNILINVILFLNFHFVNAAVFYVTKQKWCFFVVDVLLF